MAEINVEMLREKLHKAAIALSCIGEVCVDVSKQHISAERAIDKIRNYLYDTDVIGSRYRVDKLIEDCMKPQVYNTFEENQDEWLTKYWGKWVGLEHPEINYPDCCDGCSNNPKNGGSGICNCTLPYIQNPVMYSTGDSCMANNIGGGVYFTTNTDNLKKYMADADRIADAHERIKKKYMEE